jgi:hypothetical protein
MLLRGYHAVELAEGRVSQVFLQAIEMGEMYSRKVAVTLGESNIMLIRVAHQRLILKATVKMDPNGLA